MEPDQPPIRDMPKPRALTDDASSRDALSRDALDQDVLDPETPNREDDLADDDRTAAQEATLVAEAEAEAAALGDESGQVLGTPGPPLSRRSPFMIGLLGAAGVGVTYEIFQFFFAATSVMVLIGLSLFLAIGLEPAVQALMKWRIRRGWAVLIVALLFVGAVGGFLAIAIPPLVTQSQAFIKEIPNYVAQMRDHSTTLGRLDSRFHIQENVTKAAEVVERHHGRDRGHRRREDRADDAPSPPSRCWF